MFVITARCNMAATFLDPRSQTQYFIENGWACGGETPNAFEGTEENFIVNTVKPGCLTVLCKYSELCLYTHPNVDKNNKTNDIFRIQNVWKDYEGLVI